MGVVERIHIALARRKSDMREYSWRWSLVYRSFGLEGFSGFWFQFWREIKEMGLVVHFVDQRAEAQPDQPNFIFLIFI